MSIHPVHFRSSLNFSSHHGLTMHRKGGRKPWTAELPDDI
jgi:hypothetical protein